jgi:hypothetical protein
MPMPAIAKVRHLLSRRSEAAFVAGVARDWGHMTGASPRLSTSGE